MFRNSSLGKTISETFLFAFFSLLFLSPFFGFLNAGAQEIEADLLVVGGTESGCAAAVQAARMGVKRIVLVNDIAWLGGQFSAEGLGAIDENRAHGYDGTVPIPRSGIFRDVIEAIEEKNAALYGGVRRPGNGWVITAARPVVSEQVFRELLAPFEKTGSITRHSHYRVDSVLVEGKRVAGVVFQHVTEASLKLTVRARLTIDASDWGDVIKASGAAWDAGMDAQSEFGEPSAPETADPATDMNPITWCMILEQRVDPTLFPRPNDYDPAYFDGKWGWIGEEFAYTTRRLVDGVGFGIKHPDIILVNNPPIDYPLDVYPQAVAQALEATEPGSSQKNIVAMTPEQREIVFRDARLHSLKYYYFLQSRFEKFRHLSLSEEFGTADRLPPKPYIRESLRLVARHVLREQEVTGFENRSNYATVMFPDAIFSWQFEMDFHPTKRSWRNEVEDSGPWEADFRGNRRFHRGGTGRAVFPLRSLIPVEIKGLLGAQKNLGYSSIVSSSCRLHDQSIHAGQACGAVAAVSLKHQEEPGNPQRLPEIWTGLLDSAHGAPLAIWPFSDLEPNDPAFAAIQQLALRRALPLNAWDTAFRPDEAASSEWLADLLAVVAERGYTLPVERVVPASRREVAEKIWEALSGQPVPVGFFQYSLPWKSDPSRDGLPDVSPPFRGFNFSSRTRVEQPEGFVLDYGGRFSEETGFGWVRDLTANTRERKGDFGPLRSGFVFTRTQDVWECEVENGIWEVDVCLGDADHEQRGQYLSVEGQSVAQDLTTEAGRFQEIRARVKVSDGRLTLVMGREQGGSNTCVNWIVMVKVDKLSN